MKKTRRAPEKQEATYIPSLPVMPRPERLPLDSIDFSWTRFEEFCRDLIARLPRIKEPCIEQCNRYGRSGEFQKGIDIVARLTDGTTWVFQCRQRKRFTRHDVQLAVADTKYVADRSFLLISCEANTTARDAADEAGWQLWDIRDLSNKVRELELASARELVEHHFGGMWRTAFLGRTGPAPFLTAEEYFRPTCAPHAIFTHTWQLVGRSQALSSLHDFVSADDRRIVFVEGRGGIGKSKLLLAFDEQFKSTHPGTKLLFVSDEVPTLGGEAFDELPTNVPCVIVVDDAHRREDMGALLATICRRLPNVKAILTTRPHAVARLRVEAQQVGFDSRQLRSIGPLQPLSYADTLALARQTLDPGYEQYIEHIARVTADCPLVTVVAGKLLNERQVPPTLLERDQEFRHTVLDRFRDIILVLCQKKWTVHTAISCCNCLRRCRR